MRKTTVKQLHETTGKLVDAAAQGDVIVIYKRGKAVAELRAYVAKPVHSPFMDPERVAFRKSLKSTDSDKAVDDEREDRR